MSHPKGISTFTNHFSKHTNQKLQKSMAFDNSSKFDEINQWLKR
jgi:hypothetical protein